MYVFYDVNKIYVNRSIIKLKKSLRRGSSWKEKDVIESDESNLRKFSTSKFYHVQRCAKTKRKERSQKNETMEKTKKQMIGNGVVTLLLLIYLILTAKVEINHHLNNQFIGRGKRFFL